VSEDAAAPTRQAVAENRSPAAHRRADPTGRPGNEWLWLGLRGLGQTLITAGAVLLLFLVYEVWISNIFAHQKQVEVRHQLEQAWASGKDPLAGRLSLPGGQQNTIRAGTGIANLYIPRFGNDYAFTIVEGTDDGSLERGPGHYVGTALPGGLGNFAVAGHRVGKGEPFLNLDQLRPGDPLVVQAESRWYVYRVKGNVTTGDPDAAGSDGIRGREVVSPSDTNVIQPVPGHPGRVPTERLMTFTTCDPKYTATQRLIIHSALQRTVARSGSALPKELAGGTI
jgi:sortase A